MMAMIHGDIQFECDGCGEVVDASTRDFDEARAALVAERWRTQKISEVWVHHCPGCQPPSAR